MSQSTGSHILIPMLLHNGIHQFCGYYDIVCVSEITFQTSEQIITFPVSYTTHYVHCISVNTYTVMSVFTNVTALAQVCLQNPKCQPRGVITALPSYMTKTATSLIVSLHIPRDPQHACIPHTQPYIKQSYRQ